MLAKMSRSLRILLLLGLLAALLAAASGCSSSGTASTSDQMAYVLNTNEYVLYQNIFYNGYGAQYNGKRVEKTGVFTALQDAYYNRTRYYVWGYNDNTRCCDWQWEILPLSTDNLPANGSLVKVQGTFADSEDALDGYWIRSAEIETLTAYTGPTAEVDMAMMSDTLERVQLASVVSYPDQFEGKSYSAYGRIAALNFLEDPYYDNSWQVPYVSEETAPAVGSESLLRGVISAGTLGSATFSKRAE